MSIVSLDANFDFFHSKLVAHEQNFQELKNSTSVLELALWKAKLDDATIDNCAMITRSEALVNCGADVIIPNDAAFLAQAQNMTG